MQRRLSRIVYDAKTMPTEEAIGWDSFGGSIHNLYGTDLEAITAEQQRVANEISAHTNELARLNAYKRQLSMGIFDKGKSKANAGTAIAIFSAIDKGLLSAAQMAVINAGHVIQLSQTRKGNALIVSVYDGKDNDKVYPETLEDLQAALEAILEAYGAEYEDKPLPPTTSKPTRSRKTP